jgi:hypothetical protein
MTLRQFFCSLHGHLPVTKYGHGSVQPMCFLCERKIGHGWHTKGLTAPRVLRHRIIKIAARRFVA